MIIHLNRNEQKTKCLSIILAYDKVILSRLFFEWIRKAFRLVLQCLY